MGETAHGGGEVKICVTFSPAEIEKASTVISAMTEMLPFRRKDLPERDGYFHTYLTIREPRELGPKAPETSSNFIMNGVESNDNRTF